jgi:ABC-type transport system involved in multi-copper enzyme maturation permease subunit
MGKAIAIARREIEERMFVFVAAVVVTVASLVTLIVPYETFDDRFSAFAIVSVIVGTSFVAGLSGILGMSLVGRELSEKRMSFYFARPLSPAAIWFGKLGAAVAIIVACTVIVFTPSFFFLPRIAQPWLTLPIAFASLIGGCLLLLLASHALSTILRSRSPMLAVDFAGVIVFLVCTVASLAPLMLHHASLLVWSMVTFAGVVFVISVVAGGARQLACGRVDVRRNHFELSRSLWIGMAVTLAAVAAFTFWMTSATPRDMTKVNVEHAPAGAWVFATGAVHRSDYEAAFLVDVTNGRSIEVPPQFAWFGQINNGGTGAVWIEPSSSIDVLLKKERVTLEVVTVALAGDGKARHTGIFINGVANSLDVTPDLSRVAVLNHNTLTVYDTVTRRSLGSAMIKGDVRVQFLSPNEVLVSSKTKTGDTYTIRIDAFDVAKRKLETRIETTARGNFVVVNPSSDGRMLLMRTFPGKIADPSAAIRLFDLATGREITTIAPEADVRFLNAWLLDDGRIAVTALENGRGHLRIYSGKTIDRDLDLATAAMTRIDAVNGNQLIISQSNWGSNKREAMLVDINRGVIARAEGLMAVPPQTFGASTNSGRGFVPVFLDANGEYVTWNPATGARKRVL